jgi:hypothetical protein
MLEAVTPGTVGPRPEGDPEAMRQYATSLRSLAELLKNAGDGAADSVDAATFKGPAGNAARFRAGQLRKRSAQRARHLATVADVIAQRAGGVERAQSEWNDRRELIEQRNRKLGD